MTNTDPLLLRCLALTGSFETGKLPPACFSSLAGDFDGQGLSFSCLQWNVGQKTLQPLLGKMFAQHAEVMAACFGSHADELRNMLAGPLAQQLGWARSLQGPMNHQVLPQWVSRFATLGSSPEWQAIAQASAAGYFDHARFLASELRLKSDRAVALLFDCCVQNGGIPNLALRHLQALPPPEEEEHEFLCAVAVAVADVCNPRFRQDVLSRKMTITNGNGTVHGVNYDLAAEFGL